MRVLLTVMLGKAKRQRLIEIPESDLVRYKNDEERKEVINDHLEQFVWEHVKAEYEIIK